MGLQLQGASQEQLAGLAPSDRALLIKYARIASITETSEVERSDVTDPQVSEASVELSTSATTTCYTATSTRVATGIAGNVLYKSWHVGRWCKSGTTVTSASRAEQGWQTYWPGWSGKGLIGGSAAVISNQGRSYSQHSFQFQFGTPSPTQYTQPCTRIRGTATPGYYADFVCGLYS
ncbi:MAG TPA: hypothetical protein VF479_00595 [Pseudolysinimonas sp.]